MIIHCFKRRRVFTIFLIIGFALIDHSDAYTIPNGAYSDKEVFTREIPLASPGEAFARCVRGFRDDNLGLPTFVPYPVVENRGDDTTGVGLVLRRAPLELKEGIIDFTEDRSTGIWTLYYKVLNPSYLTFPVEDHIGIITFSPRNDGCFVQWTVLWTPLPPKLLINIFVKSAVFFVINCAIDYVARAKIIAP